MSHDNTGSADEIQAGTRSHKCWVKVQALVLGGVAAVCIGSILCGCISIMLGTIQTGKFLDSLTAGVAFGFYCAMVSAVVVGLCLLLVIPAYLLYGNTLSVRAASITGILAAVSVVAIVLVATSEWRQMNSYGGIIAMYMVMAAVYGELTGYFASLLEHGSAKKLDT